MKQYLDNKKINFNFYGSILKYLSTIFPWPLQSLSSVAPISHLNPEILLQSISNYV